MTKDEFLALQPGDWVILQLEGEPDLGGQVHEGPWTNVGIISTKQGNGKYITWDDGDRSQVGFEFVRDIEHITKSDIPLT
jgi:hypothetical protein